MSETRPSSSSFRDPSGFIFERDGVLLRQVNRGFESDLDLLESSGLQEELVQAGLVVPFVRRGLQFAATESASEVIQPERVPFISYPYEWSFSQLKDAALTTLEIARRALERGMMLKDASAYNVQFLGCRPVHIDTLSFESYQEGNPWVAYKQFCQHFLAPLALMAHCDIRLSMLLRTNLDGIPLDLAASLLPGKTKFQPGLLTHIHLHAKAQDSAPKSGERKANLSKVSLFAFLDSLRGTISGLNWKPTGTEWADYYTDTNYSTESFAQKESLVADMLGASADAKTCWDLGANNGAFSRLAVRHGLSTVAWDIDPAAVEKAYGEGKASKQEQLLPLLQDLRNPSTDLGWAGRERDSLTARGPADVLLALALVHHLAIGNNVPLRMLAEFLATIGKWLIIEFVPKEDSQVQRMLVARKDIFPDYHQTGFEEAFGNCFELVKVAPITGTVRTLYLCRRKS